MKGSGKKKNILAPGVRSGGEKKVRTPYKRLFSGTRWMMEAFDEEGTIISRTSVTRFRYHRYAEPNEF